MCLCLWGAIGCLSLSLSTVGPPCFSTLFLPRVREASTTYIALRERTTRSTWLQASIHSIPLLACLLAPPFQLVCRSPSPPSPVPAASSEHTILSDRQRDQPPSQLSMSITGGPFPEHYNPGPIGRCSLQMQGSPTGSVTSATNTTRLGAAEARCGYFPPPAFATPNHSGIADPGYGKCISLPCNCCTFADQLTIYLRSAFHRN